MAQRNRNKRTLLHRLTAHPHAFSRGSRAGVVAKVATFALKNRLARPSAKFRPGKMHKIGHWCLVIGNPTQLKYKSLVSKMIADQAQ
jgi:hypothetical protein